MLAVSALEHHLSDLQQVVQYGDGSSISIAKYIYIYIYTQYMIAGECHGVSKPANGILWDKLTDGKNE